MSSQKTSHYEKQVSKTLRRTRYKCLWSRCFCKNNIRVIKGYIKATLTYTTILTFGSTMTVECARSWLLADDVYQQIMFASRRYGSGSSASITLTMHQALRSCYHVAVIVLGSVQFRVVSHIGEHIHKGRK